MGLGTYECIYTIGITSYFLWLNFAGGLQTLKDERNFWKASHHKEQFSSVKVERRKDATEFEESTLRANSGIEGK